MQRRDGRGGGFFASFMGSTIDLIWLKVDEAHHGFGSIATRIQYGIMAVPGVGSKTARLGQLE
jgi:hypothetical protein